MKLPWFFTTAASLSFFIPLAHAAAVAAPLNDISSSTSPLEARGGIGGCTESQRNACTSKGQVCNNDCSCGCQQSDVNACNNKGSNFLWSSTSCTCGCNPSKQTQCTNQGTSYWWDSNSCSCGTGSHIPPGGPGWRRSATSPLCKPGLTACRVGAGAENSARTGQWECLDITHDIDSCGGCVAEGSGQDCSSILGVNHVACIGGQCVINSCERGFVKSANGTQCEMKIGIKKASQRVIFSGSRLRR